MIDKSVDTLKPLTVHLNRLVIHNHFINLVCADETFRLYYIVLPVYLHCVP